MGEALRAGILDEGEFRHVPMLDPTGRWVVFARNNRKGVEYGLIDLRNSSVTTLVTNVAGNYTQSVSDLYAWSPNGRWLAWLEPADVGRLWTVTLRDMESGAVAATGLKLELKHLLWLGPDTLAVEQGGRLMSLRYADGVWRADYAQRHNLLSAANRMRTQRNPQFEPLKQVDAKTLVSLGDGRVAYTVEGNLWELDLATGETHPLTDWPVGTVRWLDYSPARRMFLFCRATGEFDGRFVLMQWSREAAADRPATPLTDGSFDALKGSWVAGGYAYVADYGAVAQLWVVDDNGDQRSFFDAGSVWSYQPDAGGVRAAAIASEAMESLGLWTVDFASGQLRQILQQTSDSPTVRRHSTEDAQGRRVDYTVYVPVEQGEGSRWPVFVLLPFAGAWSGYARALPHMNVLQVVPGVRAAGKDRHPPDASALLAVLDDAQRRYPVDTNRVYLAATSGATVALGEVLRRESGRFRGVILDSPAAGGLPDLGWIDKERTDILVSIGSHDEIIEQAEGYVREARRQGYRVWLATIPGMGHTAYTTEFAEQRTRNVMAFIHTTGLRDQAGR